MVLSHFGLAGALGLATAVFANGSTAYTNNTNTNCVTASEITYQQVYFYASTDTQDLGFYTQSQGTCDTGSSARVHLTDPSGFDIDCGYVALDGNLNLISCSDYARGYMTEGMYTVYWETVPASGQYSWNSFTITHSQSTVTAAAATQSVTVTPTTVITQTFTNTLTSTQYDPQATITTPSGTVVNTILVTPSPTTITTTTTSWYAITFRQYAQTITTAVTTAACTRAPITNDYTANRKSSSSSSSSGKTSTSAFSWFLTLFRRGRMENYSALIARDDVPNTVGMAGQPATTTSTPNAVVSTVTAPTSTSTITSTTNAATVTVTSQNPTPTVTVYSGVGVSTTTKTLAQVTKSVVKSRFSLTAITTTSTITYTKKVVTTPACAPTPL